jgi:glycyl-tRNA synthetase (class II)
VQRKRDNFMTMLTRKMFVVSSFEIYGGVAGLYDYGPPGCALMQNMIDLWRQHFVRRPPPLRPAARAARSRLCALRRC